MISGPASIHARWVAILLLAVGAVSQADANGHFEACENVSSKRSEMVRMCEHPRVPTDVPNHEVWICDRARAKRRVDAMLTRIGDVAAQTAGTIADAVGPGPHAVSKRMADAMALQKMSEPTGGLADRWHRKAGLWAFETCNASSWRSLIDHDVTRTAADVVFAQETRLADAAAIDAAAASARASGWAASIGPAHLTDKGRATGGCAVLASGGVGVSEGISKMVDGDLRNRLQHAWCGCALRGGVHCISIYLRDSVGVAANLDLLHEVGAREDPRRTMAHRRRLQCEPS